MTQRSVAERLEAQMLQFDEALAKEPVEISCHSRSMDDEDWAAGGLPTIPTPEFLEEERGWEKDRAKSARG